jgi:alkanesulfonate monooxygenase SsuD/methylene tetrahydromethanopterin reductase-like flavin-dependent oxidoreductase (luciferase family)
VIIGDPDHCAAKVKGYEAIGADRLMCLMQFGSIPHREILRSIELTGEHLIAAAPAERARAGALAGT